MQSYRDRFPEFRSRFDAESHFLHLVVPSVVRPGEEFAVRAVIMDATGMPAEDWTGRIPLEAGSEDLTVPPAIEFTAEDCGMVRVDGLVMREPGAAYLTATPPGCPGEPPTSNVLMAREDGPRLYWGDIHAHTLVSNCHPDTCKSPEFGYWYGRDVALLDFCAAADHLRGIHREDGNWDEVKDMARRFNQPGEFATLLAFESSHATGYGGDINVYYRSGEADYFWLDRDDMRGTGPKVPLDRLWQWLDEQGVPYMTIPHHTARAGKYRNFEDPHYNPEREPVLEVYSWWGSSEARHDDLYLKGGKAEARAYWRDALELGCRYGAIGSSDTHHTMPGTPFPLNAENYGYAQHRLNCQGVAAVYADELERGAVFDAMMDRRCYGTTWWRPVIDLSVNGRPMGSETPTDADLRKARRMEARVAAVGRGSVTLLRNNQPIARERLDGPITTFTHVDEEPLDDLWIRNAPKSPVPFVFYWLRVEAGSGQVAWVSPVWITG